MEVPVVSKIMDLLIDLCKDAFPGLKGKFQLLNIKRRLKKQIFDEILSKYGNTVFYNDLDHFLTDNDVICNIIRNCCDTSVFRYKSKSQMMDYYVQLFVWFRQDKNAEKGLQKVHSSTSTIRPGGEP